MIIRKTAMALATFGMVATASVGIGGTAMAATPNAAENGPAVTKVKEGPRLGFWRSPRYGGVHSHATAIPDGIGGGCLKPSI